MREKVVSYHVQHRTFLIAKHSISNRQSYFKFVYRIIWLMSTYIWLTFIWPPFFLQHTKFNNRNNENMFSNWHQDAIRGTWKRVFNDLLHISRITLNSISHICININVNSQVFWCNDEHRSNIQGFPPLTEMSR